MPVGQPQFFIIHFSLKTGDCVNPFVNLDSSANSTESKSDKSDSTSKSN